MLRCGLLLAALCTSALWHRVAAADKPAFLLTAPQALMPGATETLALNVLNPPKDGHATIQLLAPSGQVLSETSVKSAGGFPQTVSLDVPKELPVGSSLAAIGKFGRYSFDKRLSVKVADGNAGFIIIIQTDKPVYRAGEVVRLRVLSIDHQKLPLAKDAIGDVWVENTNHFRVAQWHNVSFSRGVTQLEMELSKEPPLGQWKIFCRLLGRETRKPFQVDEYALPKFGVEVVPPPYIFPEETNTTWKICAQYVYGKPVKGQLRAQLTLGRFHWASEATKVLPSIDLDLPMKGCHEFTLNGRDLLLANEDLNRRPLILTAEVTEEGTGVTQHANVTVRLSWSRLTLEFLKDGAVADFKPGLPHRGALMVTQPDGTPAPGENVNICFLAVNVTMREVSKGCRDFKSGPDGLVRFSVPGLRSSPSSLRVTAKAEGGSLNPPTTTLLLQPWRSLSQRYLRVLAPGQKLKCGVSTPVRFHYTKLKNHSSVAFNYQVFSGRRVVEQGRFEPRVSRDDTDDRIPVESGLQSGGFITAELSLEPKPKWGLSSKARLLLYYAHPKGELIGDSRQLQVEPCASNPVLMHFAKDSAYPGTTVGLSLSAASGSLCGVWALDRGLLHKDSSAQLTPDKLELLLEPLEPKPDPSAFSSGHCRDRGRVSEALHRDRYLREPLSFLDATAAFEESAVQVLTDLKLDIHDCDLVEDDFWRSAFPRFSTDVVSHHGFDSAEFEPRANEPRVVPPEENVPADPPKSAVSLRTHFPETWLWEMHSVDREGSVQFERELPHSVTQWQAGALCLHPTRGVGLSNAALNALQPFFAQLTLPAVAKRGELVPVTASLFSYLQACVPVKLSLNADSACMKLLGEPQKRDCLCGSESIVLQVQVRPLCLGAINITLHALGLSENKGLCDEGKPLETRQARDSLRKSLLVTAEGQPREKSTAKYICLNGSNEGPQKHEFPLELPRNVVSGSSRGVFTLSGNVGSPVSVDSLDKLVRLPTGCGEQNLALLAPNVFVLDYLNSSGERGHPLESKLKENIAKGYQRQLNYRHAEGGYSAFGSQDPEPSLWLTAFAVRTFGRSRRFMPIDEAELGGSIRWILSNQYDNGCFPSVGRVLNSRLKGGLEGHSLAPLTAYVLISLLEAGAEIPQVSRVGAVRCLLQELQQQQQDSHTMALAAYAFSLFEDSKASELLASLRDKAQPGNGTEATLHWHENVSTAVAVETASYVVLASLKLGNRAAAKSVLPVVRWVLEQRNHDSGFVSTQDTVVALQALAEYAKATSSSDTRLQIRVSSEGLGSTLIVNRENALLKQELFLPVVPTVLHIEATGTGCAFIQATVKYNVPASEEAKSFGFWVTALHASCRPQVKVCASYLVSWAMSGMVIVQVKMQSGYRFEKLSGSPQVKRHEVDQDQVNLYFEELSNRKSCALLELVQDYIVENAVPATVTLQDYYEPGVIAVKNYTIPPCLLDDDNGTSEDLQETLIQSESVQSSRVAGARFHGFRNVDHDLDFPEGPEANAQVVVPAPPEFEGLRSCPRCHDEFPADFTARYCAAQLALRVEASSDSTKKQTLWVSDDLSSPLEKPVTLGRSASYELRGHCSCPTLSKGETFLVLGPSTTMSTDEKNATHLHLARNVDIVHVQDLTILETAKLHSVRQRC